MQISFSRAAVDAVLLQREDSPNLILVRSLHSLLISSLAPLLFLVPAVSPKDVSNVLFPSLHSFTMAWSLVPGTLTRTQGHTDFCFSKEKSIAVFATKKSNGHHLMQKYMGV